MLILILILSILPSSILGEPLALPKIVSEQFNSLSPQEALRLLVEISNSYLLESQQIPISLAETQANLHKVLTAFPIAFIMGPALEPLKTTDFEIKSHGEFCYFYPLNIYVKYTIDKIHLYFSRTPKEHILGYFLTILETTSLILEEHLSLILKEIDRTDVTIKNPFEFLN